MALAPMGSPSIHTQHGQRKTSGPPRPLDPSRDQVSSPRGCGGNIPDPCSLEGMAQSSPRGCGGNSDGPSRAGGSARPAHAGVEATAMCQHRTEANGVQPTRVWRQPTDAALVLDLEIVQPTRVWRQRLNGSTIPEGCASSPRGCGGQPPASRDDDRGVQPTRGVGLGGLYGKGLRG